MKKLLSIVLVCFFSAYLLSACTTILEKILPSDPKEEEVNVQPNVQQQNNPLINLSNAVNDPTKQEDKDIPIGEPKQQALVIGNAEYKVPTKQEDKDIPIGEPMQQALVIGNAEYKENPLTNPVNDAIDMANALKEQGFTVSLNTNLTRSQMEKAIREFKNRLFAQKKSVGLFYFSGHGAQVDGKNYLMPVNNDEIEFDDDVPWKAVEVAKVLAQMQDTNNGLNIMILDACRNNPYPSRIKGEGKGLASIIPPEGVIIGYATKPGHIALELGGRNSLYTKHLLQTIESKKRIDDILMNVSKPVQVESNGKQIPWYRTSMTEPFCFNGCP